MWEPGCGKPTTLDLRAPTMVPRPLRTENLTAPVPFRLVDRHQPTLLLAEEDSCWTQADQLRVLLAAIRFPSHFSATITAADHPRFYSDLAAPFTAHGFFDSVSAPSALSSSRLRICPPARIDE